MPGALERILEFPQFDTPARTLIRRAFERAERAHAGQTRAEGSPYIVHPASVALYLADLGFDAPSVAAALLHDVIEDCGVTRAELAAEFGTDVAFLVDGVTKLKSIRLSNTAKDKRQTDLQTESLKKMFFAMADDLRVIIIKLADRLHNMQTLEYKDPAARARKSLETMEIYAPIADRLGMGRLKGELEDLAFPYAYPAEYAWLKKTVKGKYEDRLRYIERAAPVVSRHLDAAGVTVVDIHARAKRMWSLYRKLKRYGMDPDKIMDLVALRIIVPDVKSCYEALGVIHAHYKPMPGRVKDFIALPKPNGYRSLHTTVFCEKGRVAEIQVRTPDMHDHAENGVAAHWAYAEQGKGSHTAAKAAELAWVNQLKKTLRDIKTSAGMANLKIDFFKDRIFVLTPHGDVKDLPDGATPVDFAYTVHSELGHRTQGALVNGKLVPLTHRLQSGDVVEIQKARDARPSKNWLRFVHTTHAAKHIRSWFKTAESLQPVEPVRAPRRARPHKGGGEPVRTAMSHVIIAGQPGLAYKLGKCCSPNINSPIAGYLTVSRGVTVHRAGCTNLKAAPPERLLDAAWS
ncbi:MAG TPA: RelA/SpoT family protein [Candidatus Paceibacterota bacterium]|nr:RelA/SpoT family protein [Candidatus Paceibacterota bacterium]